ncbi:uncharacterized protein LOC143363168 [Halictus rubicundus]|uniref:uncharacterized protein LOC143363168 n=1 Tax=Halictus rubicundus TaxID=77578 RepID=UPI00403691A8
MSTISDCVRRQLELYGLISRAATDAKKAGTDLRTSHHLRARLTTLERNWEKFKSQHDLIPNAGEKGSDVATYVPQDTRSACEEAYISSYAALQKELQQVLKTEASTSKEESTGSSSPHPQRLPRLDLPKFSGEYTDWISFRDLFTAMVISNPSIPNVEKLQYLKMCLSGEASQLIAGVAVTDDNFKPAWKVVTDRYENKRVLVDIQLDLLFSLKRLTAESGVELKRLHNTTKQRVKPVPALHTAAASSACVLCREPHYIGVCSQYQANPTAARKEIIKENRFNCLGKHPRAECRSSRRCTKCGARHHSSLHEATNNTSFTPASRDSASASTPAAALLAASPAPTTGHRACTLLGTALVKIVAPHGEEVIVRALLDSGSEISFVRESLVQQCRLPRNASSLPIQGIGAGRTLFTRGATTFTFTPATDCSVKHEVTAFILAKLTNYAPGAPLNTGKWPHLRGLDLADPDFLGARRIDVVLGADVYSRVILPDIRRGPEDHPTAQPTTLGWVLTGAASSSTTGQPAHAKVSLQCSVDDELLTLLQRFWEQEDCAAPRRPVLSPAEDKCEKHFRATHSRDTSGQYIVRLPFERDPRVHGDSRETALRVLSRTESRFANDPALHRAYASFLYEYAKLDHMRPLTEEEHRVTPAYYLPHHGVFRDSEIRVVFNGSSRSKTGISLNECLFAGAKLQTDLADVILRWRLHTIAFATHIEKMYSQVSMHRDDHAFQRILWRRDPSGPVVEYALTTVTYGLKCAPFQAHRCVQQLVADEGDRYPLAAPILRTEIYVDDILSGAASVVEGRAKIRQLNQLAAAGGFRLRKWIASDTDLLVDLPRDALRASDEREVTADSMYKTLGLYWNVTNDSFRFEFDLAAKSNATKRSILSVIATLYDPLGWIAPVTVTGKILMKELWTRGLGWDDPLPDDSASRWEQFAASLVVLRANSLPRWIGASLDSDALELHGFSDASNHAMGAVVYLRARRDDDTISVAIMSAKTRVAPLKRVTIPRLELTAALILSRLVAHVREALDRRCVPVHLWTDSSVALAWIRGHPSRWKDYVQNRVLQIHELAPDATWHHVPGCDNPADLASRGATPQTLADAPIWWRGPAWLVKPSPSWPVESLAPDPQIDLEARSHGPRVTSYLATISDTWIPIHAFSSLTRLTRVIAWCLRAISRLRQSRNDRPPHSRLSVAELNRSRRVCVKPTQNEYFRDELLALRDGKHVSRSSPTYNLTPFLDEDGILRVGGRLQHAGSTVDRTHPIILPRAAPYSDLVMHHAHLAVLHGGAQLTLARLRREYWVIRGRSPIRRLVNQCVVCVQNRGRTCEQLIGQLPGRRVTPSRAFLH